jgi:hypothetical protein
MREISLPLTNRDGIKKLNEKFIDMSYEERRNSYAKSLAHLNKPREEVIKDSWGNDD